MAIEFLLILFFAYNVFDKFKAYIIFSVLILTALLILFFSIKSNREMYLILIIANVIILIINFSRRSYLLNANDKLTYQIKAYQSSYEKRNNGVSKLKCQN